ncbi:hypothetical protein [Sporosarcina sp.]|uniref:hypothetical protein n=1 Tax=Sporosarcina sp. TaxID=49982 RepID=UPI00262F4DA7|nr:hypothetical protein [Sporosarcina sp.]
MTLEFHLCGHRILDKVLQAMPLISVPGGRFPRAWLEPPRPLRYLRGLKAHAHNASLLLAKVIAFPAGRAVTKNGFCEHKRSVGSTYLLSAALHYNQLVWFLKLVKVKRIQLHSNKPSQILKAKNFPEHNFKSWQCKKSTVNMYCSSN